MKSEILSFQSGNTPLHSGVCCDHLHIVQLLLTKVEIDPNRRNKVLFILTAFSNFLKKSIVINFEVFDRNQMSCYINIYNHILSCNLFKDLQDINLIWPTTLNGIFFSDTFRILYSIQPIDNVKFIHKCIEIIFKAQYFFLSVSWSK